MPAIDFYTLKGILELLSRRLGLGEVEYGPRSLPYLHPTRSAVLISGGLEIGCLGELHPGVAKLWDLPRPVIVCELDLETLIARADPVPRYNALPRYPVSLRDIAVVAPREVSAAELELCIRRAGGELVEEVILFDVYQGGQIPAGERSLAFAIRYRSPERTLTDEQVNTIHRNIISALSRIGARLRE